MGLFDKLKNKTITFKDYKDNEVIALGNAEMIDVKTLSDVMFKEEMMGPSVAFKLKDKEVYAPCNGTLEVLYPTGHAFAIRMKDNTGILVHIGINTVKLKGKGFTVFAKQGQEVKAGDKIVAVDLKTIKNAGLDDSVILIKTEEGTDPPVFKKKIGEVKAGDIIS